MGTACYVWIRLKRVVEPQKKICAVQCKLLSALTEPFITCRYNWSPVREYSPHYSMAQIPFWEANRFLASQKNFPHFIIPAFTRDRYISLSWARPIKSMPPSHFPKIYLNIILPPTPGSSKWSLFLVFSYQNPVYTSPHTCYMHSPSSRFDHPNNIWWGSLSSSLCSFLHSTVTSSLLGPNILFSTLFSNTQPMFLPQRKRPRFTPIQNNRQNYSCVCRNLIVFLPRPS
jgi:hypothetical protein